MVSVSKCPGNINGYFSKTKTVVSDKLQRYRLSTFYIEIYLVRLNIKLILLSGLRIFSFDS